MSNSHYNSPPHFEDPLIAPKPHKLIPDLPANVCLKKASNRINSLIPVHYRWPRIWTTIPLDMPPSHSTSPLSQVSWSPAASTEQDLFLPRQWARTGLHGLRSPNQRTTSTHHTHILLPIHHFPQPIHPTSPRKSTTLRRPPVDLSPHRYPQSKR